MEPKFVTVFTRAHLLSLFGATLTPVHPSPFYLFKYRFYITLSSTPK